MLAKRKMSVTELTEKVGITMANLSILKNGKARAIRFSTLEAVCAALDCQPGDILEFKKDWFICKSRCLEVSSPEHGNMYCQPVWWRLRVWFCQ